MKPAPARRRTLAVVTAGVLVATACSSPQGTEAGNNSLLGKDKGRGGGRAGGSKEPKPGNGSSKAKGGGGVRATPAPGQPEIAVPEPGTSAAPNSGAAKTETKFSSTGTDPRSATVLVTEPDPDAEKSGLPPDYADIVSTRVEGLAKSFRVTITFRGTLPSKMPDDKTYMVAGFAITGSDENDGYAFGASADTDGWKAYGGSKDSKKGYPGTISVQGDTMVFTTPWSAVGGPRAFDWYAQETWFRSLAGTTHYSLDNVPNEGPAKYPAG